MDKFKRYLEQNPMTDEEIDAIVSLNAMDIIERLKSKKLDSNYVLLAFQHKAYQTTLELNCITEFLDVDYSDTNLDGPLAGLPISLKENVRITGKVSCFGLTRLIDIPRETSVLLKCLRKLGAVPFCRTNVPQSMMSFQSCNPIYGITLHPTNIDRCPGGSSSGEAALVARNGSPLGVGSDIGGSVRVPSLFCGIVGFKPTAGRLNFEPSQPILIATWGFLCQSVSICQHVMRCLVNDMVVNAYDGSLPPVIWKEIQTPRLRIGLVLKSNFKPSPASCNCCREVASLLQNVGHEVVEIDLSEVLDKASQFFLEFVCSDGFEEIFKLVQNDLQEKFIQKFIHGRKFFGLKRLIAKYWYKNYDLVKWLDVSRGFVSVHQLWRRFKELSKFRKYTDQLIWKQWNLDLLICPGFGTIAFPIDPRKAGSYTGAAVYSNAFNILNYPAGVLPVRTIKETDLVGIEDYYDDKLTKSSSWHNYTKQHHRDSVGLPIGIQVVARTWNDEMCIHGMSLIESAIKQNSTPDGYLLVDTHSTTIQVPSIFD